MFHMNSQSNKRKRISGVRDFPYGCGNPRREIVNEAVQVTISESEENLISSEHSCVGGSIDMCKEDDSVDSIMKKARFNVAPRGDFGNGKLVSDQRKFTRTSGSKVKPLSPEESHNLIASQSIRRQLSVSSSNSQRNSPEKEKKMEVGRRSNQTGLIPVKKKHHITEVLSPREKVLKALRLFKVVFEELQRDKAARRGESKTATTRIDYKTRNILLRKQVNAEKMIGEVPGIEVGDVFQYKSELNLVGLHFNIMGGIDYMSKGGLKLATSIVSSEGTGYSDVFNSGVLTYTGEGGNASNDQELARGNLALANSMRERTPVRVTRGKARSDQRGKDYVYDGLYMVENYWQERGPSRNVVFKFKLVRVSGQPSGDSKH